MIRKVVNLTPDVLDEHCVYTFSQLCQLCRIDEALIFEMIEEGVIDPEGREQEEWRFSYASVARLQRAHRLHKDLDVNLPGVALSVDLLEEIEELRATVRKLEARLAAFRK